MGLLVWEPRKVHYSTVLRYVDYLFGPLVSFLAPEKKAKNSLEQALDYLMCALLKFDARCCWGSREEVNA